MPKKKIDFDVVRELALALPGVEESTLHGAPSLKLRGRLLACPALHKSAEMDSLAIRIDFDQRAELLADRPNVFYITEHYIKYQTVLVRLSQVDKESLTALVESAWRFVNSQKPVSKKSNRKKR